MDSTLQILQDEKARLNFELQQALDQVKKSSEEKSALDKELENVKIKNVEVEKQLKEMLNKVSNIKFTRKNHVSNKISNSYEKNFLIKINNS